MNSKDLRYIKTEEAIRSSYLSLKKVGKRVKISELCDVAKINKSTFYDHYESLDGLEKVIKSDLIDHFIDTCPTILSACTDPYEFFFSFRKHYKENSSEIIRIFDADGAMIRSYIENALIALYNQKYPSSNLLVPFIIAGISRTLVIDSSNISTQKLANLVTYIWDFDSHAKDSL